MTPTALHENSPQTPIGGGDIARLESRIADFRRSFQIAREQIARVIVDNQEVVDGVVTCLLARGHGLLEGIPGVGKTRLVQTVADVLHLKFARIQFTPDLMPGDIVGSTVLTEDENGERHMRFAPGPIFAHLVLADEINRATSKTQSALLEAMQENSATVGTPTYPTEQPMCVLATQNPIELEGTYPLPEAQLDRFLFKLKMGFPTIDALHRILERTTQSTEPRAERVLDRADVLEMREIVRAIPIAKPVLDYAIRLTVATHPDQGQPRELVRRYVRHGSSPRGAQALVLAAKVKALLADRLHVACEDIRAVALPALRHRILLNFEAQADAVDPDSIIADILGALPEAGR